MKEFPKLPTHWMNALKVESAKDNKLMIKWHDGRKVRYILDQDLPPAVMYVEKKDFDDKREKFKLYKDVEREDGIIGNDIFSVLADSKYASVLLKPLVKLKYHLPNNELKEERDKVEELGIKTYQSSIPYDWMLMIEYGIHQMPPVAKLYYDIEVDSRAGYPNPKLPKYRVTSWSGINWKGEEFSFHDDDERKLMLKADGVKAEHDERTGFNIIGFDEPYWGGRERELGIHPKFSKCQPVEIMSFYLKYNKAVSVFSVENLEQLEQQVGGKLDDVARRLIGKGKLVRQPTGALLWDWFTNAPEKLREYNMQDAKLVQEIDQKFFFSNYYTAIAEQAPVFLRDTNKATYVGASMYMEMARKLGLRFVLPRPFFKKVKYEGAYIKEVTKPHYYANLGVMDEKGFYPSTIKSVWASPEVFGMFQTWKSSGLTIEKFMDAISPIIDKLKGV